jgi:hypothetical protein
MVDEDSSGHAQFMSDRKWAYQGTLAIPALRRLRQKDCWEFKSWPGLYRSPYLKRTAMIMTSKNIRCTRYLFLRMVSAETKGTDTMKV